MELVRRRAISRYYPTLSQIKRANKRFHRGTHVARATTYLINVPGAQRPEVRARRRTHGHPNGQPLVHARARARARSPCYRERRDGRQRIVLPILPSSMTLGDDHREGANVLLLLPPYPPFSPPAPRSSCPGSLRRSPPEPSSSSDLLFPPPLLPSSLFCRVLLPPLLSRVPYARVIITAAIRHASLATLCLGESLSSAARHDNRTRFRRAREPTMTP